MTSQNANTPSLSDMSQVTFLDIPNHHNPPHCMPYLFDNTTNFPLKQNTMTQHLISEQHNLRHDIEDYFDSHDFTKAKLADHIDIRTIGNHQNECRARL